jgi:hypothetical protein
MRQKWMYYGGEWGSGVGKGGGGGKGGEMTQTLYAHIKEKKEMNVFFWSHKGRIILLIYLVITRMNFSIMS